MNKEEKITMFIDTQNMEERYEKELYTDYLEQENKQYESDIKKMMYEKESLERYNKQLKERIDKAIKILEQDGNEYESEQYICEAIFILKGDSNED